MFVCLFFINLFFFIWVKENFKNKFIFFMHPLLHVIYLMACISFVFLKHKFIKWQDEKKVLVQTLTLVDAIKSYLQAGMLPAQTISAVLSQRPWCHPIKNSLSQFCNYYAQGKSLQESLENAAQLSQKNGPHYYLYFLFSSLKISCYSGENIIYILDKVKQKTQNRIELTRKLKATTAQMKLQSIVILFSPFFLGVVIFIISPSHILFFINNFFGNSLAFIMVVLYTLACYFLKKLMVIK